MHICTVVELATKFVTVIDGKLIGISRHKDYSLFHFKAHDVKALTVPISKFIFVDAKAEVDEVIQAEQLAARGVNYKTAKRDTATLTDVELAEVSGAVELAQAALASSLTAKPGADMKPQVVHTPAAGVPKVFITAEAAATGFGELLVRAESAQAAETGEAGKREAAVEAGAAAETEVEAEAKPEAGAEAADAEAPVINVPAPDPIDTNDEWDQQIAADLNAGKLDHLVEAAPRELPGEPLRDEPEMPSEDSLGTVKPSRTQSKKRRR